MNTSFFSPKDSWGQVASWRKGRKKTRCLLMDLYTVKEPSCSILHISRKPASASLMAKQSLISACWDLHHRAPKSPDTLLVGVYLFLFIYPIGLFQQVWEKGHREKNGQGDSLGLLATEANDENRPQHHQYSDNVGWGCAGGITFVATHESPGKVSSYTMHRSAVTWLITLNNLLPQSKCAFSTLFSPYR